MMNFQYLLPQKYFQFLKRNEVETATPEKILILLYDGAIQFLNKAKIAMEQKNIPEIHNNIIGCENIILEFINTVDVENGKITYVVDDPNWSAPF